MNFGNTVQSVVSVKQFLNELKNYLIELNKNLFDFLFHLMKYILN